jgi:hypothetical protein
VESCCERGNEPSGSIKCWETTEWLHNLWPLERYSVPQSYFFVSSSLMTETLCSSETSTDFQWTSPRCMSLDGPLQGRARPFQIFVCHLPHVASRLRHQVTWRPAGACAGITEYPGVG